MPLLSKFRPVSGPSVLFHWYICQFSCEYHTVFIVALKLGHDTASFMYLWLLFVSMLKYVILFLWTVFFNVCEEYYVLHLILCPTLSLRAVFSRTFCLAVCASNPFFLISAPYSICQVNSSFPLPY